MILVLVRSDTRDKLREEVQRGLSGGKTERFKLTARIPFSDIVPLIEFTRRTMNAVTPARISPHAAG